MSRGSGFAQSTSATASSGGSYAKATTSVSGVTGTGFTSSSSASVKTSTGTADAKANFTSGNPTGTVTPRLTQRWDMKARAGVQRLAYRGVEGGPDLLRDRVDRFQGFGAGVGFRFGQDTRVGFNVDRERRESPVKRRAYLGYRTGLSVTYGR